MIRPSRRVRKLIEKEKKVLALIEQKTHKKEKKLGVNQCPVYNCKHSCETQPESQWSANLDSHFKECHQDLIKLGLSLQ